MSSGIFLNSNYKILHLIVVLCVVEDLSNLRCRRWNFFAISFGGLFQSFAVTTLSGVTVRVPMDSEGVRTLWLALRSRRRRPLSERLSRSRREHRESDPLRRSGSTLGRPWSPGGRRQMGSPMATVIVIHHFGHSISRVRRHPLRHRLLTITHASVCHATRGRRRCQALCPLASSVRSYIIRYYSPLIVHYAS